MNRKMITVMAAASVFAALACGTVSAQEEDITGNWYMQSMVQEGQTYDATMLASIGFEASLTLGEDGSAQLDVAGEVQEGTYEWDGETGAIIIEEEGVDFTVEDGILSLSDGVAVMNFGRDQIEGEDFTLADPIEEAELADFNGEWAAESFVINNFPMPISSVGMDLVVTIEDGDVTLKSTYGLSADETEEPEEDIQEVTCELDGGALVYGGDEESDAFRLQLREDGTLTYEIGEAEDGESVEEETEAMSEGNEDLGLDALILLVKVE